MKTDNSHLEANIERLLRAAMEANARPGPEVRSRMTHRVANLIHAQRTAFPEPILGILGTLVLFIALSLLGSALNLDPSMAAATVSRLLQLLGALNLIVIPFAGLVIILRRRKSYVSQD